jgi:hypothetical protein
MTTDEDPTRDALIAAALRWRIWFHSSEAVPGLGANARLSGAVAAYKRAHQPPPVPTEPGEWYLADGRPALVYRTISGYLLVFALGSTEGHPNAFTWAADADGQLVPVPHLEVLRGK